MSDMDELVGIFAEITSPRQMMKFMQEMLTASELRDLSLRWELMKRLHRKVPQRKIAADLHISLCKITRGAKVLKNRNSISRKILAGKTDD